MVAVELAVLVGVDVRVGDAVDDDVALSVGVGDVTEKGAENSEVLLLMSVWWP
ncbi:MAG TPA: hypothetical protein VL049_19055 [Candidatus Dormibacteraeota bacterium]|nr:hypothetical protein [Candidatus Dormibacteraeota bacterium]